LEQGEPAKAQPIWTGYYCMFPKTVMPTYLCLLVIYAFNIPKWKVGRFVLIEKIAGWVDKSTFYGKNDFATKLIFFRHSNFRYIGLAVTFKNIFVTYNLKFLFIKPHFFMIYFSCSTGWQSHLMYNTDYSKPWLIF